MGDSIKWFFRIHLLIFFYWASIELAAFTQLVCTGKNTKIPLILLDIWLKRFGILDRQIWYSFIFDSIKQKLNMGINTHNICPDPIYVGVYYEIITSMLIVDSLKIALKFSEFFIKIMLLLICAANSTSNYSCPEYFMSYLWVWSLAFSTINRWFGNFYGLLLHIDSLFYYILFCLCFFSIFL